MIIELLLNQLFYYFQVGLIALSPVDQLPKIKLYKDEFGYLKGDASICYNAPESVEMAINIFDGGYIRPNTKPISVSHAEFQKKEINSSGNEGKRKKGKISHAQVKVTQNAMAQALAWNESDDLGIYHYNNYFMNYILLMIIDYWLLIIDYYRCIKKKSIKNCCN